MKMTLKQAKELFGKQNPQLKALPKAAKKGNSYPEQGIQIPFVKFFRDLQDSGLFFTIPNLVFIELNAIPNFGAKEASKKKRMIKGSRNKLMGYKTGFPDIEIIWSFKDELHRTAYIETKSKTGTLNPEQKKLHARFKAAGIPIEIMRSVLDGQLAMVKWGIMPPSIKLREV